MVINSLLEEAVARLEGLEYSDPLLEARLLLAHVLEVDKLYIHLNGGEKVGEDQIEEFFRLVDRRAQAYPLQYLLGEASFMGLDFQLEEGVLIPRWDTEVLVEYVLDYIDRLEEEEVRFLDLGIGSGAIVLSTAYHRPQIEAYGVDIDQKPLEVTRKNMEAFGLKNVKLYQGDLFQPLESEEFYQSFHIIASNPPYIDRKELDRLQQEVRDHEPRLALDGGEDGLDFYRRIIQDGGNFLREGGLLILEIGHDQGERVAGLLEKEGFKDIEILKDLQGLDRVVLGHYG